MIKPPQLIYVKNTAPFYWSEWASQLLAFSKEYGKHVEAHGRGPGSLEPEETAGLDYHVVAGKLIHDKFRTLWNWYKSFAYDVSEWAREPCIIHPDMNAAVNLNYLNAGEARYEKHTDTYPYTMLVWVTGPHEGGETVFEIEDKEVVHTPRPGWGVIFDGSIIPHYVRPTLDPPRLTIPMVFIPERITKEVQMENVNSYLYGKEVTP